MFCSFVSVTFILGYKRICVYLHDGKHGILISFVDTILYRSWDSLQHKFVVLYYFM